MRPLGHGRHRFMVHLVLAALVSFGCNGAMAQFIDNGPPGYGGPRAVPVYPPANPGYPGYGSYPGNGTGYPNGGQPALIFPPGLPEPKPFVLDSPSDARRNVGRRCVAGAYICPADGPERTGADCSCATDTGRALGRIEPDQDADQ